MPFQVSPGVNVSEFDLTTIVPAVATTRAGISFPTEWGPANEAVLIDTPKTFREIFGDLKQWNAANYMTALNFLGYSQGLLMVRAMSNNSSNTQNANTGEASGDDAYAPTDAVDLTTKVASGFMAKYAGEKGTHLPFLSQEMVQPQQIGHITVVLLDNHYIQTIFSLLVV